MKKDNTLYLVIPCYKEEEVLHETAKRVKQKMQSLIEMQSISEKSRVLFVNDGSSDRTWQIIQALHGQDPLFSGVNLSRNKGHQKALLAGLMVAKQYADMIISMDADLQDDINAIDQMVAHYHNGYDVVYGVRSNRDSDTPFKRITAVGFYRLMQILGVDIIFNHADYRLMSKRAVEALSEFEEVNVFLRGIVPQIGFPFTTVDYVREKRFAGESKYPLKKMLSFAFDGITSFSVKPMRMILHAGALVFFISLVILFWSLIQNIMGHTVSGWTSLIGSIWLLGGIQLLCLGVVGEYIGKIYSETKKRPHYFIESILNQSEENK